MYKYQNSFKIIDYILSLTDLNAALNQGTPFIVPKMNDRRLCLVCMSKRLRILKHFVLKIVI